MRKIHRINPISTEVFEIEIGDITFYIVRVGKIIDCFTDEAFDKYDIYLIYYDNDIELRSPIDTLWIKEGLKIHLVAKEVIKMLVKRRQDATTNTV